MEQQQENDIGVPAFRLQLPSVPENVAVVRQALAGAAGPIGLEDVQLLDVNAAVSEACNNVVVHAYPDDSGPMDVQVRVASSELEVIVGDQGIGIRPNEPTSELEIQGLGLSLIQTLSDRVELSGGIDEGTTVEMAFNVDSNLPRPGIPFDQDDNAAPSGELAITVSPGPMAAPVLGRVTAMLATRAGFSIDGIADAQLVTDALAAYLPKLSLSKQVPLGIDAPDSELRILVGPLIDGGAEKLLTSSESDGVPPVFERLTEAHTVERGTDGEILGLTLVSPG
jgi:anti-sigma regulatory factor (Ser/Thr protein kinase)